jgi:NAD(P)-dependent dehydrogenase (short-subunit alcohol dehydrogenase family)
VSATSTHRPARPSPTVGRFGALHILHNNAYWARSGRTVLTLDEADWDRTLAVCLESMFLMSRSAIPHML